MLRLRPATALRSWWRDDELATAGHRDAPRSRAYPTREIARRLWPDVRPLRWWVVLAVVLASVMPVVDAVSVWLWKLLVDDVLVPGDLGALRPIALAFLGVTLAAGALSFASLYVSTWLGETFILRLRTKVFGHLHTLSLDFFERRKLGDLLSRLTGDVDQVETFIVSGGVALIRSVVTIVVFSAMLLYLQWKLTLVALVVAPVFWLVARSFARHTRDAVRDQRRFSGGASAVAEESLHNVALVQAYNRAGTERDRYLRQGRLRLRATLRATRLRGALTPTVDLLELAAALAVFALGTLEVKSGRLTIGGFLAFIAYLAMLLTPVRGLSRLTNSLFAASAGTERILEILDQRPSIADAPTARPLSSVRGHVELDAVTFTYPGVSRPSVHDVAFTVESGETVALVGPSGAGKSTLAKLLLRFYDPQEGVIRLDDRDLRTVPLADLRRHIAVVWQEALVFDGTIVENVAYGRDGVTRDEVLRACDAAGLDDVVAQLDGGYDAPIGQKGRLLSGGQRQRVAIARAMVRDAPVLILDEPTSNLDAGSADRVLAPLRRLVADRTTVIISHNLLTVRDADRIVVLDGGTIAAMGTHDTLLAESSLYADLYQRHREPAVADPA